MSLEDFRRKLQNRPQEVARQHRTEHDNGLAAQRQIEAEKQASRNQQLTLNRTRWVEDLALIDEMVRAKPGIYARLEIMASTMNKGPVTKTVPDMSNDNLEYKGPHIDYTFPFRSRMGRIIVQTGVRKKYSPGSSGGGMGGSTYSPAGWYDVPVYGLSAKQTLTDHIGVSLSSESWSPDGLGINFFVKGWNEIPTWHENSKYKTLFSGPVYMKYELSRPYNPNLAPDFELCLENNYISLYDDYLRLNQLYTS